MQLQVPEISVTATPEFTAGGFAGGDGGVSNTTNAALNFQQGIANTKSVGAALGAGPGLQAAAIQEQTFSTLMADEATGHLPPGTTNALLLQHQPMQFISQDVVQIGSAPNYFSAPTPFIIPPAQAMPYNSHGASAQDWLYAIGAVAAAGAVVAGAGNTVADILKSVVLTTGVTANSGSFARVGNDIAYGLAMESQQMQLHPSLVPIFGLQ